MITIISRLVASVLIFSFLALPVGLSARERRGANLIVTRLDGSQVSGELIAVKPDSLLLLSAGSDLSISLVDIKTVRIVRKSRAGLLALIGFVGGAVAGGLYGSVIEFESGELVYGAIGGGLGVLAGLGLSLAVGPDITFQAADEPESVARDFWDKLRRYSRQGRSANLPATSASGRVREPRPGEAGTEARPRATPAPRQESRFRLGLSGSGRFSNPTSTGSGEGLFRFPDELAPDAGPHPFSIGQWQRTGDGLFAGVSAVLAYKWRERWSLEVEIFDLGSSISAVDGELRYVSSTDGKTYVCSLYRGFKARFTGLMLGLSYRPFTPTLFRRHIVEFGAAVGPALVRGLDYDYGPPDSSNPIDRKVTISGRVQVAYDYYLYPGLSVGAVVGYRLMQTRFSGETVSGEEPFFEDGTYGTEFWQLTEISLPTLPVKGSGAFFGLRFGFRI